MVATETSTLDVALQGIRGRLRLLPELRRVYEGVPDSVNQLPGIVVYPVSGRWHLGSHSGAGGKPMRWGLHTVAVELMVARKDLERDMQTIMYFTDLLPDWLFVGFKNDQFGGAVVTLGDPRNAQNATSPMRYSLTEKQWGDQQVLVYRLELDVATEGEISV